MYESISKNNELENEMTLDMSYFRYSDDGMLPIEINGIPSNCDGNIGRPSFLLVPRAVSNAFVNACRLSC